MAPLQIRRQGLLGSLDLNRPYLTGWSCLLVRLFQSIRSTHLALVRENAPREIQTRSSDWYHLLSLAHQIHPNDFDSSLLWYQEVLLSRSALWRVQVLHRRTLCQVQAYHRALQLY